MWPDFPVSDYYGGSASLHIIGGSLLGICANLPQFTCWTQRMGEVAYRSLYPCFPQVVADVMA